MAASRCWRFPVLLALLVASARAADPPIKVPPKPVDFTKFPPGTIFVVGGDAKDLAGQPGVIVLSPEEFAKMRQQLEQLTKQLGPDQVNAVTRLHITGKVDGDLAHLQCRFVLVTSKPKAQVPIGCQKAWPTAAHLDKGCVLLPAPAGEDGYVVQVDQPGEHRIQLDLEAPVTARGTKGTDRGLEVGLPRSVITLLEHLDVPDPVKDLKIAGRGQIAAKDLASRNPQHLTVALGAVDKLDISWRGPAPVQPDPLLTSQGQIDVRIDDMHVTTESELTLQVLRGQASQWQLQLPAQGTHEVDVPANDERITKVVAPVPEAKNPVWTVQLKEASAEPLKVRIRTHQTRVAGKAVAIGPFAVVGAVRQYGTLVVSAPPHLRLRFRTTGRDINQREVPEELRRGNNQAAAFSYWSLPPAPGPNQPGPPMLDVDVEPIKGAVESSINHTVRLTAEGWAVASEIDVKPVRTEVERIEVELPPDYTFKALPPILVEPDLELLKDVIPPRRVGVIRLARPQSRPFKVVLEGTAPASPEGKVAALVLPRPLGSIDGGAKVTISVGEGQELTVARDAGQQTLPPDRREHILRLERAPARIEVAWREQRAELPVENLVDVIVSDRLVLVRQRLRFPAAPEPLKQIVLKSPEAPAGLTPVSDRAVITKQGNIWTAVFKDAHLPLEYSFPLPEFDRGGRTRRFAVPLFWPEGATRCQTKVRVWTDAGVQPALAGGPWEELPTEEVADRDSLPALVARGGGLEAPLALRLAETQAPPLPALAIDRALIQATLGEGGHQTYRARFLVTKLATRSIDVELPAPTASLNPEILLDGKRVTGLQVTDEEGKEAELGRVVRLKVEPELYRKPIVLEVRYQLPPGRVETAGGWQTPLHPPRLRGNVFVGRVRWEVGLPADRVVVLTGGDLQPEQRWLLRGALLAPRPAVSALDLERWLTGNYELQPAEPDAIRNGELVGWQSALRSWGLVHVSQRTWLLGCSLALLVIGLGLAFLPMPRRLFWAVLALLGLGVVAAAVLWPNTLAMVAYGAEPGAAVLILVVGVQWLMQRRYRRQVVFMPGFTRVAPGSSVLQPGSSHRPRHEPSTVDAMPKGLPEIGSRHNVPR